MQKLLMCMCVAGLISSNCNAMGPKLTGDIEKDSYGKFTKPTKPVAKVPDETAAKYKGFLPGLGVSRASGTEFKFEFK